MKRTRQQNFPIKEMFMVSIIMIVAILAKRYHIAQLRIICLTITTLIGDMVYLHQTVTFSTDLTNVVITFKHFILDPLPFGSLITFKEIFFHLKYSLHLNPLRGEKSKKSHDLNSHARLAQRAKSRSYGVGLRLFSKSR